MIKMNMTFRLIEVELIIASLYAKHTPESRQLAAQIKRVRDEHAAMFGRTRQQRNDT
jgi:hypothetical protein